MILKRSRNEVIRDLSTTDCNWVVMEEEGDGCTHPGTIDPNSGVMREEGDGCTKPTYPKPGRDLDSTEQKTVDRDWVKGIFFSHSRLCLETIGDGSTKALIVIGWKGGLLPPSHVL